MASSEDIPRWEANSAAFCARIEMVRSPLKIVLKTKNDPFFIERWIKHHIKIVGPENLIIFDNMSDDPEVLSTYLKYGDQIHIIQFAGPHNNVHHIPTYNNLYRSLAKSSKYFLFVDTDEYLVLIENATYCDDSRILHFILENRNYAVFPTVWLWNTNWSSTQFHCGTEPCHLALSLACGKPLIRSDKIPFGYVNHNFQLGTQLFAPPFKSSLFLLHLAHLFPTQRISGNVNKLIARGIVQSGESPEAIASRNDITDEIASLYVKEIRDFLPLSARKKLGTAALNAGCLELLPDGAISYYGAAERKVVNEFIVDPKPVYDLIADRYRLSTAVGP